MKLPIRQKYVDELLGAPWFIFGEGPQGVDVSNGNRDILTQIPKDLAVKVIAAHERFMKEVYGLLC